MEYVKDMKRVPCHDCACKVGEPHLAGCDMERCPKCKGQLISCDCFVEDDKFNDEEFQKYEQEKWSGISYEEVMLICEEKKLYTYWKNGWNDCDEKHPDAMHDINRGVRILMERTQTKL